MRTLLFDRPRRARTQYHSFGDAPESIESAVLRVFFVRKSLSARLQRWLDRKFFREAYNSEVVLSELSEQARRFTEKGPLIETVSRRIADVLHVEQIAVWLRGSASFQLQSAMGLDIMGPVLLSETSATVPFAASGLHPILAPAKVVVLPLRRPAEYRCVLMARVCEVCGRGPQFGNRISHAHNVTKRRWNLNLQSVHALVNGAGKRIRVCTSCIRSGKVQKAPLA